MRCGFSSKKQVNPDVRGWHLARVDRRRLQTEVYGRVADSIQYLCITRGFDSPYVREGILPHAREVSNS